jgi:hypothetical protein
MDNTWLKKRNSGIHMTIRDVDCENYDAERMAREFHEMGVSFFSFFAGGYITTYPSKLPESRLSPWLGDQDVTGDIVKAAHKYGIKAIAMADFSVLPPDVYAMHPDWAMVDKNGKPYETVSGMYTGCVMCGYAEEYGRAMVAEILENYDVDGMKFGGGSYGFNANICHCARCQDSFREMYGLEIPEKQDWDDPTWKKYYHWRTKQTAKRVQFLHDMVTSVRPDMPVMGNGVAFGHPGWTINSALDMEGMAAHQDMIQLEAQDRVKFNYDMSNEWADPYFTNEESVYMTNVTDKPIWIVASYFKAWPWRRSAVDYAEQKAFLAQIVAGGASPMVNLAGGPPVVHEDKRGFQAPAEIWRFVRDHNDYFTGDRSGADVAFVYSDDSMVFYGKNDPDGRYLAAMRGYEQALREQHIPFDIISKNLLNEKGLARYKTLILTNYACMSETEAKAIEAFVKQGGNVVATYETSLYNSEGEKRNDFLLADLFGAHYLETANTWGPNPEGLQNYLKPVSGNPLTGSVEDAGLIPITGDYCKVELTSGKAALTLEQPFIVFPEGLSYAVGEPEGNPCAVVREHTGGGKTVYFPVQLDKMYGIVGFSEIGGTLAGAASWTLGGNLRATCDAPDSVLLTLRLQDNRANVHLVNRTGGRRMLQQIVPVHDVKVQLSSSVREPKRAFLLSTGEELALSRKGSMFEAIVPVLGDYDVVVFE